MNREAVLAEDTKKRICSAAAGLFFENGYEKTTLRMIAAKVGMTHVGVLKYFSSKLELASHAFISYVTGLIELRERMAQSLPFPEADADYYHQLLWWSLHFKLLSENQPFRRFYISYLKELPSINANPLLAAPPSTTQNLRITRPENNTLVSQSMVIAADAMLASLIDHGLVDCVLATKLMLRNAWLYGLSPDFDPSEQEVASFIEAYIAGVEVDILHDFLLADA